MPAEHQLDPSRALPLLERHENLRLLFEVCDRQRKTWGLEGESE